MQLQFSLPKEDDIAVTAHQIARFLISMGCIVGKRAFSDSWLIAVTRISIIIPSER